MAPPAYDVDMEEIMMGTVKLDQMTLGVETASGMVPGSVVAPLGRPPSTER